MNKVQQISNKLLAKLNTLVGANKPFTAVYDHYTLKSSWFPYVSYECSGFEAEILDNNNNIRNYKFDLYIFQEVINDDRQQSTQILYKAMSDIIDMVDKDYTLEGVCDYMVVPVAWSIVGVVTNDWKTLVASLQLNCKTITYIR